MATKAESTSTEIKPIPSENPPALAPGDVPAAVEAVLLAVDKALPPARIAEALGLDAGGAAAVREAVDQLNLQYEQTGRSFRIEQVAGGYRVMTLPAYAGPVAAIRGMRESHRLSRAAIETLAIVAYRQPVTRVAVETIRGVACGEVLRTLLERRLITIVGRAEELGRPMLYGTSKHFLEQFGLASIKDLPPVGDVFPEIETEPSGEPSEALETDPQPTAEAEPGPEAESDRNPEPASS
ncbi:MAG: SMC-Scp complex subunit ScpB [Planctomycetota bacterium]